VTKKKAGLWTLKLVTFLVFAGLLYRISVFRITKNFDVVDPGRFYRSAQLTPEELDEVIHKYGIKTVISVRGAPENSEWVKGEKAVLERDHVKFVVASWMTDFFPDTENFRVFARALKEDQYPMLVHCRQGADRTGEASAIYGMTFLHETPEQAIEKNMSFDHWHLRFLHPAKSEFIRRWKGLDQMLESYDLCSPEYRDYAEPKYCPEVTPTTVQR